MKTKKTATIFISFILSLLMAMPVFASENATYVSADPYSGGRPMYAYDEVMAMASKEEALEIVEQFNSIPDNPFTIELISSSYGVSVFKTSDNASVVSNFAQNNGINLEMVGYTYIDDPGVGSYNKDMKYIPGPLTFKNDEKLHSSLIVGAKVDIEELLPTDRIGYSPLQSDEYIEAIFVDKNGIPLKSTTNSYLTLSTVGRSGYYIVPSVGEEYDSPVITGKKSGEVYLGVIVFKKPKIDPPMAQISVKDWYDTINVTNAYGNIVKKYLLQVSVTNLKFEKSSYVFTKVGESDWPTADSFHDNVISMKFDRDGRYYGTPQLYSWLNSAFWSSSNENVIKPDNRKHIVGGAAATTSQPFQLIGPGTAKVTASIQGKSISTTVTVKEATISGNTYLAKGKSTTLSVKNAYGSTQWKTNNPAIASVSSAGVVKGLNEGCVTIMAKNNGKTICRNILVFDPAWNKSAYYLNKEEYTLSGEFKEFKYNDNGAFRSDMFIKDCPSVTYTTSNAKVATVDENGTITPVGTGTATISAKLGIYVYKTTVKVYDPKMTAPDYLLQNKTGTVKVTGGYGKTTYESSDNGVLTVTASGSLKAVGEGEARITVINNGRKMTKDIKVIKTPSFGQPLYINGLTSPHDSIYLEFNDNGLLGYSKNGITYSSSNAKIAKIDPKTGAIQTLKEGTVTISAKLEGVTYTTKLKVDKSANNCK